GVLLNFDDGLQLSFVDVDNFKQVIYLSEKRIIRNLAKFNAHSYSGLAKMDGKKLNHEDRKLFLHYILKLYKNRDFNNIDQNIKNETLNILKKWDKDNLFKRCN
ncbi:hypothetical protein, partial [Halanaerobium sp.]|uniref:hypothetical protein n=1 Tax=Halanaerobium sp. TaxID=1895664 RepID=UPI000DE60FE8